MEPNNRWPRRQYSKKFWWLIEQDRKEFPWGGSIWMKIGWVCYRTVNGVLHLFGKKGI